MLINSLIIKKNNNYAHSCLIKGIQIMYSGKCDYYYQYQYPNLAYPETKQSLIRLNDISADSAKVFAIRKTFQFRKDQQYANRISLTSLLVFRNAKRDVRKM